MRLKRSTQLGATLLLFCLVLCFLLSINCSEAPFEPDDGGSSKDYRIWSRAQLEKQTVYAYHSTTGETEAHNIPWEISSNITVSHDGRLLYVPSFVSPDHVVKILETDSLRTVSEIPYFFDGLVIVSPDGRYLALTGDSLRILSTSDYSIVYADTLQSIWGIFSANGDNLYLAHGNVMRVSLSDPENVTVTELIGQNGTRQVIPTLDESKLLMYSSVATSVWVFNVYDIGLDSIIYLDYQIPGNGLVAMTPDGRYAFYGNPGTLYGPAPLSEFTVFDIDANRAIKRVVTSYFIDEPFASFAPVTELIATPDGRWLLAARGQPGLARGVFKYDIRKDKLVDYFPFDQLHLNFTIQSIP